MLISALVWFPKGKLALPDGPGTASCPSFPVLFPNYELAMDLRLPHCLPSLAQSSLTSALLKGKESFPSYHLYVYGNPDLRQAFANLSFIESIRFPIFWEYLFYSSFSPNLVIRHSFLKLAYLSGYPFLSALRLLSIILLGPFFYTLWKVECISPFRVRDRLLLLSKRIEDLAVEVERVGGAASLCFFLLLLISPESPEPFSCNLPSYSSSSQPRNSEKDGSPTERNSFQNRAKLSSPQSICWLREALVRRRSLWINSFCPPQQHRQCRVPNPLL